MKRTLIGFIGLLWVMTGLPSCHKSAPVIPLPVDTGYASRITFLLQYNPAVFQTYYNDLVQLGLTDSLSGKGPFTVFAYNNQAVPPSGYPAVASDTPYTSRSIIPGLYSLEDIPPGQTEIINGPNGFKWIATAAMVNGQVRYSVNGAPVLLVDQPASNGLVNVMSATYPPVYYPSLLTAIQSSPNFIEFAYALQRTHLDAVLADTTQSFTVFAPLSMGGLQAIRDGNLDSLTNVVGYHILPGRFFGNTVEQLYSESGYYPSQTDTLVYTALNGEPLLMLAVGGGSNNYGNLYVQGQGDFFGKQFGYNSPYYGAGVPAGLGVIQQIANPLTP